MEEGKQLCLSLLLEGIVDVNQLASGIPKRDKSLGLFVSHDLMELLTKRLVVDVLALFESGCCGLCEDLFGNLCFFFAVEVISYKSLKLNFEGVWKDNASQRVLQEVCRSKIGVIPKLSDNDTSCLAKTVSASLVESFRSLALCAYSPSCGGVSTSSGCGAVEPLSSSVRALLAPDVCSVKEASDTPVSEVTEPV